MKRSAIQRKSPLRAKSRLRVAGHSEVAETKRNIQALLRAGVIARDKGCVLRNVRLCGGEVGYAVLQADHLISRANSATYADMRLVVCVCVSCHAWKSLGGNHRKAQYDALVKTLISPERVALWEACELDSWRPTRTGAYDWKLAEVALQRELKHCFA
jgi:hypothetical protein